MLKRLRSAHPMLYCLVAEVQMCIRDSRKRFGECHGLVQRLVRHLVGGGGVHAFRGAAACRQRPNLGGVAPDAVSYTHLDVYKRHIFIVSKTA